MSLPVRLRAIALACALPCALFGTTASAATQAPAPACADDPHHHQLDFLIGNWEAFKPGGQKYADVTLAPALDGCVVTFAWQPVKPGSQHGNGWFTYSRLRDSLMFLYAGNQGSETAALRSEGGDGDIGLFVEYPSPSGHGTAVRRMGLTRQADGSIHETQRVSDNGGPFKQTFESTWRRKAAAADLDDMGDRP